MKLKDEVQKVMTTVQFNRLQELSVKVSSFSTTHEEHTDYLELRRIAFDLIRAKKNTR